jgi:hypothetical protein
MIYKALIIPHSSCNDADSSTLNTKEPIAAVLLDVFAVSVIVSSA